jgi:hypothetical protein
MRKSAREREREVLTTARFVVVCGLIWTGAMRTAKPIEK